MSFFNEGYLLVSQFQRIYYAEYGNPIGPVACVIHGGPGSGCRPSMLDWFDLSYWRVILVDQRGAGKSEPLGELSENTTQYLVDDMELLRRHLAISHWLLVGGSWGTIPTLLYASQYKKHITGIVLRGIFLARQEEMQWFFQALKQLVPDGWHALTYGWSDPQKQHVLGTLIKALLSDNFAAQQDAALRWEKYEDSVMAAMLGNHVVRDTTFNQIAVSDKTIAKYRIQAHYLSQDCFVHARMLFRAARTLHDIACVIVHGTHDWICPPNNARLLQHFMPHAQMMWVANGTHTPGDTAILNGLQQAIRRFVV